MFNVLKKLGPGIIFAAMAIGVSHLVQSTRAGADYGLSLSLYIVVASLLKYPLFRFAVQYSSLTGNSLLTIYRRIGWHAVTVMIISLFVDMFISTAAVSVLTAGIVKYVFGIDLAEIWIVAGMFACMGLLLAVSGYKLFEAFSKYMVLAFSIMTILAVILLVPAGIEQKKNLFPAIEFTPSLLLFLVAVAGWMPNPASGSFFLSAWSATMFKVNEGHTIVKNALFDINIGYLITIIVGLCFVFIGAVLIYAPGDAISQTSPAGFAKHLIGLFTSTFGSWSFPIIATTAITVMFSTQFALMDGAPRMMRRVLGKEETDKRTYIFLVGVQIAGVLLIIHYFMGSFATFIDFATSFGFATAPFIGYFNHKAIMSAEIEEVNKPSRIMQIWSIVGIISLLIMGSYFFWSKLAS